MIWIMWIFQLSTGQWLVAPTHGYITLELCINAAQIADARTKAETKDVFAHVCFPSNFDPRPRN